MSPATLPQDTLEPFCTFQPAASDPRYGAVGFRDDGLLPSRVPDSCTLLARRRAECISGEFLIGRSQHESMWAIDWGMQGSPSAVLANCTHFAGAISNVGINKQRIVNCVNVKNKARDDDL